MAGVRASLILPLALLPALCGCGRDAPAAQRPLSPAALAAVADKPGVGREALARAVDALFTGRPEDETRAARSPCASCCKCARA
jgi:hypothetical protein